MPLPDAGSIHYDQLKKHLYSLNYLEVANLFLVWHGNANHKKGVIEKQNLLSKENEFIYEIKAFETAWSTQTNPVLILWYHIAKENTKS